MRHSAFCVTPSAAINVFLLWYQLFLNFLLGFSNKLYIVLEYMDSVEF